MLGHFSSYFAKRAIILYVCVLLFCALYFTGNGMDCGWVIFGLFEVIIFFILLKHWSLRWKQNSQVDFVRKLFLSALFLRILYVIFIHYYYMDAAGSEFGYSDRDVIQYYSFGRYGSNCLLHGHFDLPHQLRVYNHYQLDVGDMGYPIYLSVVFALLGNSLLMLGLLKALIGAVTCILIYKLTLRNFGDKTGKIAGIMAALMPNFYYYCGINLKEIEMLFVIVLFLERTDYVLKYRAYRWTDILISMGCIAALFLFRTVLAMTAVFSFLSALVIMQRKRLHFIKKTVLLGWIVLTLIYLLSGSIMTEVDNYWEQGEQAQENSLYSARTGGNNLAKYATGGVFFPVILVMPLPTMVDVPEHLEMQMWNGAYYVKNILAFFVMLALYDLIKNGKWRQHVLLGSFLFGYLLIILLVAATSERYHIPTLPCFLIFAAYGITRMEQKYIRSFNIYLILLFIAIVCWNWLKLAGRGIE